MHELPQEVLLIVLKQVRNMSSPSSFLSCLLSCRRWCDLGLPLLHSFILLRNSNLESFSSRFPHAKFNLIKSLTVRIDPESPQKDSAGRYVEDMTHMNRHGSSESRILWDRLRILAALIKKMNSLLTFSFVVAHNKNIIGVPGYGIPTSTIAWMIDHLPKGCVNLEIDSGAHDCFWSDSVHLCDKIRHVLPRLRHFRVRLYRLCPAMFCANVNADGAIDRQVAALSAPFLKTVIINVSVDLAHIHLGETARICGYFGEPCSNQYRYGQSEARLSLITALQHLLARGSFPTIKRLWLLDMRAAHADWSTNKPYNRRDIVLEKTWVIPCTWVTRFNVNDRWETVEEDTILTRTPEGHDFISPRWGVDNLAEAHTWEETMGGCRMPAKMIETDSFWRDDYRKQQLSIESVEAFKIRRPDKTCPLWVNEEKSGLRLLDVFEREGLIEAWPLREITPPGWRGRNEDLIPEGEYDG